MKNVSVSVDDETHRKLQIMAAEQGTSVSAMLRDQMVKLLTRDPAGSNEETEPEWRRRRLAEVRDEFKRKSIGISMKDNLTREELYQRNSAR